MHYTTHSDIETKAIGKAIAADISSGALICLHGDLGAGKTTLVKGIAEGLGIANEITSPTFTLMNVYDVRNPQNANVHKIVHIDTYRLKDAAELIAIGVEDYLGEPGVVTIIEWPEKIAELLHNKKVLNVFIEHSGGNARTITVNQATS